MGSNSSSAQSALDADLARIESDDSHKPLWMQKKRIDEQAALVAKLPEGVLGKYVRVQENQPPEGDDATIGWASTKTTTTITLRPGGICFAEVLEESAGIGAQPELTEEEGQWEIDYEDGGQPKAIVIFSGFRKSAVDLYIAGVASCASKLDPPWKKHTG